MLLEVLVVGEAVFIVLLNCVGKALFGSCFLIFIILQLFVIGGEDKTLVTVVFV